MTPEIAKRQAIVHGPASIESIHWCIFRRDHGARGGNLAGEDAENRCSYLLIQHLLAHQRPQWHPKAVRTIEPIVFYKFSFACPGAGTSDSDIGQRQSLAVLATLCFTVICLD
jgi:hypothetical protein